MKSIVSYKSLHRGGFLVETPAGNIQFGVPPETIKDTMLLPGGVPKVFILMEKMFDWKKGISFAEIEFPIYFNFFIKKKKTTIVCKENQLDRIRNMFQEAVFGPLEINLKQDYNDICPVCAVPDIRKEMDYFRNNLQISDLIEIKLFRDDSATIGDLEIRINRDMEFEVYYAEKNIAKVPGDFIYKPTYILGERLKEPYKPPLFSITCLGPSHGFDPTENTSGYVIWLNHHGIMVDPPVNSTEWLEDSNVNPKLIDSIILTHCHADHDAGTFQKILKEGRITIYSTKTVIMSFIRKYAALSNVEEALLLKLFQFSQIKIGKPVFIHGGKFEMFYTLHSIPTLGFKMEFQDQTFVYSSDHNNDPELHKTLLEKKIITKERYNEFTNFPWDSKVIYHESGVPPLHTPIAYLNSLPQELQKKTVVYHIAKKDFPAETSLALATFGMENTLNFKTKAPYYEKSYQVLNILKHLDFSQDLPLGKAQEFITIVEEEDFHKGDYIVRKGTTGDKFYIIYSGNISVSGSGLQKKKIYGTYEYFGEVALISGSERTADVIAETDVTAYSITRDRFLSFIAGTEFEKTLIRLSKTRSSETWNLLSTSSFFQSCSSYQKTWLESIFVEVIRKEKGVIQKEGEEIEHIYLIQDGNIDVSVKGKKIAELKHGDFIGSLEKAYENKKSEKTFSNKTPVKLYSIKKEDIINFADRNPGLMMKLAYDF